MPTRITQSTRLKPLRLSWTFADIVDLEYFFIKDEELREQEGEKALRQQDRTIYFARRQEFDAIGDSRGLVRRWLAARRMQQHSTPPCGPLPGKIWREASVLLRWLTLIVGILCGTLAASSLLRYSGETAVNVSGYFAVLIAVQILLLILLLVMLSLRSISRSWLKSSLLCQLSAGLLKKLFINLQRRSQKISDAETRLRFQAAIGRIRQNRQEYGSLYFWPAFILLQLFGCGFNIGTLAATLFKVSLADVAFGWQSTLQIDPQLLATAVRWIALPWSWFVPAAVAYPTAEQIEGSRIILKEGIYHLTTGNLVAWWPFLTLSVFTYGLLPRLLLFLFGSYQLRRKLKSLRFDSARFRQLQQRMLNPILETGLQAQASNITSSILQDGPPGAQAAPCVSGARLLLVPDELWASINMTRLTDCLEPHEGSGPYHSLRIGALDQSEEELYTQIASTLHENSAAGILLLQEAWQPPIRELLDLFRRLRHELPRQYPISVVLIGKPDSDSILTGVKAQDLNLWRKSLQTLGDPYLSLYPLVENR